MTCRNSRSEITAPSGIQHKPGNKLQGYTSASNKPSMVPGMVTVSGMSISSKSINVATAMNTIRITWLRNCACAIVLQSVEPNVPISTSGGKASARASISHQ